MAGKGPMFDLEDCEDVELNRNKTSSEKLLKAKNTKNIKANDNESLAPTETTQKSWHETAWGKIAIGLTIGGILLVIKLAVG